jgi:hypothetical protein
VLLPSGIIFGKGSLKKSHQKCLTSLLLEHHYESCIVTLTLQDRVEKLILRVELDGKSTSDLSRLHSFAARNRTLYTERKHEILIAVNRRFNG